MGQGEDVQAVDDNVTQDEQVDEHVLSARAKVCPMKVFDVDIVELAG
jgi:hypothetical protein